MVHIRINASTTGSGGGGGGTITLSGDVSGSGTSTISTSITNGAVTNAKVASGIDAVKIGAGTVNNTQFGYLSGITSDVQTQLDLIGQKYVRTTRFASIASGTSGSITLPTLSTVVLDDFGGTVDAIVSQSQSSLPTFQTAVTSSGTLVTTTFDSSGNYVLSGTPSSYPVCVIYRVRQKIVDFDSLSSNIIGSHVNEDVVPTAIQSNKVAVFTGPNSITTANATTTEVNYLSGVDRLISKELAAVRAITGTRLRSGGSLSRTSNTTFSISDGSGIFVDNYTDPLNPVITEVSWTGLSNITATQIANTTFTLITIDKNLTIRQRLATEQFDYYNYRDEIIIGTLQHFDKVSITSATRRLFYDPIDSAMALGEYQREVGGVIRGNTVSGVATTLTIQKASGTLWNMAANYFVNPKDPNRIQLSALNPIVFQYLWRNGAGGWKSYAAQTLLQPGYYDDNTVGSPSTRPNGTVPNNRWTIQRAKLAGNNVVVLQFGQTLYTSLAAAIDGISTEEFSEDPDFLNYTPYFFIMLKGNATDTSLVTDCEIVMSSNTRGGGGASSAITSLQQAYENSAEPEIVLNASDGALSIADNATPIGAALFQVQNNANTIQYFSVDTSSIKALRVDIKGGSSFFQQISSASLAANRTVTLPDANSNTVVPSTGAAGQFVNGVSSSGTLLYGTPSGGGGSGNTYFPSGW